MCIWALTTQYIDVMVARTKNIMSELLQDEVMGLEDRPHVEPVSHLGDPVAVDLYNRLAQYDSSTPEAEHLRPRQAYSVEAFCENAAAMLAGEAPMQRMSVIHPTGSGKTVLATEMMRIIAGENGSRGHNIVMLVPSLQILGQTIGTHDDVGDVRSRLPGLSVGQYSGERKSISSRITVMNYHMLRSAIKKGHWARINPKLVIADEVHHIIDGVWSDDVQEATKGILTVGLSATPAYSEDRDSRELFPVVLDHMTMKEGIQSGILSPLKGHMYKGEARIVLGSKEKGGDFTDEDAFSAVMNSKDNYKAAAICAAEVAKGKRGIVSCVPGHDRLHAKVMAKILSETIVQTPNGPRPINAAYIDGEMDPDERADILRRYHMPEPELDVIAFVGLLLEGWNSPLTDFGVWLRPTPSKVLAEQRIGRLLRWRNGKVATLHELVYEVIGASPQVTHVDVLEDPSLGEKYVVKSPRRGPRYRSPGSPRIIDLSRFAIDSSEIATQVDLANIEPSEDIEIISERETVPYDWPTLHVLATKFALDRERVREILQGADLEIYKDEREKRTRVFYSPDAYVVMAEHEGIEIGLPEGHMTVPDLIEYCKYSFLSRIVTPEDLEAHLKEQGINLKRCLINHNVMNIYPESAVESLGEVPGVFAPGIGRKKKREMARPEPRAEIVTWLGGVLVNPKDASTPLKQRQILLAQNCLLTTLANGFMPIPSDLTKLKAEIERLKLTPTPQMANVMQAKGVDFAYLLAAAIHAKEEVRRLT